MGFLLGLDHAALTRLSARCSKDRDTHIYIGDVHHPTVYNHVHKKKEMKKDLPKRPGNQQQKCGECSSCNAIPNEAAIQQCLKRRLSNMSNSNEKFSLVKITKATLQPVSGIQYRVDFDAKDEISGQSYSSEAVILAQPWSAQPAIVDFRCVPRRSI